MRPSTCTRSCRVYFWGLKTFYLIHCTWFILLSSFDLLLNLCELFFDIISLLLQFSHISITLANDGPGWLGTSLLLRLKLLWEEVLVSARLLGTLSYNLHSARALIDPGLGSCWCLSLIVYSSRKIKSVFGSMPFLVSFKTKHTIILLVQIELRFPLLNLRLFFLIR